MEPGFSKGSAENLLKVDFSMVDEFYVSNLDYLSAEVRNIKTKRSVRTSQYKFIFYQCPVCPEDFKAEDKLKCHLIDHDDIETPYNCPTCRTTFTEEENNLEHLLKEAKQFQCKICLIILRSLKSLDNHIRRHFVRKPCDICGKVFKTSKELQIHLATQHHEGPYCCKICQTACFTKQSLESHILIHKKNHREVESFNCDLCDKKFNKLCSLKNHIKQVHDKNQKKFVCQICGQSLHSNRYLRLHLSLHTDPRPHKCEECGKKFSTKSTLAVHSRKHTGIRPYKCQLCDRDFTQQAVLKTHLLVHTGEKPFSCNICQKTFSTKSQLTVHIKRNHVNIE